MMITLSFNFEHWFSSWSWTVAGYPADEEPDDDIEIDDDENDELASEADLRAEHLIAEHRGSQTAAHIGFRPG